MSRTSRDFERDCKILVMCNLICLSCVKYIQTVLLINDVVECDKVIYMPQSKVITTSSYTTALPQAGNDQTIHSLSDQDAVLSPPLLSSFLCKLHDAAELHQARLGGVTGQHRLK